jgi:uncharacterized protein (TIGR03435 family)
MRAFRMAGILVVACGAVFGQAARKLEYEVASVKPNQPSGDGRLFLIGGRGGPGTPDPGQVTYTGMTVKLLLTIAYDVKQYQVTGPGWIDSERYDIMAKIPEGATKEDARVMLQNLLAERFKLTLHHETKDFPLYELTVAKGGPKLKVSQGDYNAPPAPPPPPPPPGAGRGPIPMGKDGMPEPPKGRGMFIAMMNGRMRIAGGVQKMSDFVSILGNQLGSPVVDKTGLTGVYDFSLDFAPEPGRGLPGLPPPPPPPPGAGGPPPPPEAQAQGDLPPIMTAVQEQLGLKLDKTKGPLDVIVVDKGDKVPTEN